MKDDVRYTVEFTDESLRDLSIMKKSDPASFKKVRRFLEELQVHPRTGSGHPEALSGGNSTIYSRRINKKDRLVYDIYDYVVRVLVLSMKGHYYDK